MKDAAQQVRVGSSLLIMAGIASGWGRGTASLLLRAAGESILASGQGGDQPAVPSKTLHRLIYASRSTAPDPEEAARRTAAILAVARRHNAEAGLTGALLHSRRWFAQVLEGERAQLDQLYARIVVDPRHREVRLLSLGPTTRRAFNSWSMANAGEAPERLLRRAMEAVSEGPVRSAVIRDMMATLRSRLRAV